MKHYVITSNNQVTSYDPDMQKASAIGRVIGSILGQAGFIAFMIWLAVKTHGFGLLLLPVARPVIGLVITAALIVLLLVFAGICKLILKIMDRH